MFHGCFTRGNRRGFLLVRGKFDVRRGLGPLLVARFLGRVGGGRALTLSVLGESAVLLGIGGAQVAGIGGRDIAGLRVSFGISSFRVGFGLLVGGIVCDRVSRGILHGRLVRALGTRNLRRIGGHILSSLGPLTVGNDRLDTDGRQGEGGLGVEGLCFAALVSIATFLGAAGLGLALGVGLFAGTLEGGGARIGLGGAGEEALASADGGRGEGLSELRVRVAGGLDDLAQRALGDHLGFVAGDAGASLGEFALAVGHGAAAGTLGLAAGSDHARGVDGILGRGGGVTGRGDSGGCATRRGAGLLTGRRGRTRVGSRRARGGPGLVRAGDSGELGGQARDAFAAHVLLDGDGLARLDALGGARPRLFGDDPRDELLAQVCAKVGEVAGVLRRDQDAHGDRVLVGVGDLHTPRAPVPQVGGGQELLDLGADEGHGGGPVELEFDRAELGGGATRPVLEGRLREVTARNDEAALIPDAHDHVGERDFLDGASFFLLAGDDDVAHADRVGEGQLQAGEDVTEGLLGRETGDHRDDAGGGQDGGHGLAGDLEGSDDGDHAHDDDDRLGEAAQHLGLGLEAARASLVRILARLGGVLEDPRGGVGHPGQAGEGDDEQNVHEERRDRRAVPVGQVGVDQRDAESRPRSPGREREVARAAHARQDRRGRGRLGERLTCQGGQEDREDDTHEGADERAEDQEGEVNGRGHGGLRPGLWVCDRAREGVRGLGEGTECWCHVHASRVGRLADEIL